VKDDAAAAVAAAEAAAAAAAGDAKKNAKALKAHKDQVRKSKSKLRKLCVALLPLLQEATGAADDVAMNAVIETLVSACTDPKATLALVKTMAGSVAPADVTPAALSADEKAAAIAAFKAAVAEV
jgi:hypothetical protein